MNSPMLLLLTITAALLHSTAAADVIINWQKDMTTTAAAQRGDTLNFVWSGTRPVGQVATKAEFEEGFRIFLLRLEI